MENNRISKMMEYIDSEEGQTEFMKEIWFKYVVENKCYWANGFTLKRLEKVKEAVFADEHIMWDLLVRHGKDLTPEQMKAEYVETFNHCIGNFCCNIFNKMVETGIYKIR